MRTYFVTGGTGFVGREMVRQLLGRKDTESITCLTRGKRKLKNHPKVKYVIGDITNCSFPKDDFTDLIHGANDANDQLYPDLYLNYYTIVEGTKNVMAWAESMGIKRRLLISSGGVVRETVYGKAKRFSECMSYGAKIARVYSLLGEEMPLNGQFAAGRFVYQALQGRIKYYGGQSMRTYLHVSDGVAWLLKILDEGSTFLPYDVAGDRQISVECLAHLVAGIFDVPIDKMDGDDRIDSYSPDTYASRHLGCEQTLTIEESLRRVHAHYFCNSYK